MLSHLTKSKLLSNKDLNLSVYFEYDEFERIINAVLNKYGVEYDDVNKSMELEKDSITIKANSYNIEKLFREVFDQKMLCSYCMSETTIYLTFGQTNKLLEEALNNYFDTNEKTTVVGMALEEEGVSIIFY